MKHAYKWCIIFAHCSISKYTVQNNLIYELDNDGNMIPSAKESLLSSSSKRKSANDPLHLPEVQSAMLSHLQTNSSQWATPDLLDTIFQKHPKLARGMNDPRYMAALQSMQTQPKETLERLKTTNPEIVNWLMEFCGVMGEHFVKLGGDAEEEQPKGVKEGGSDNVDDEKVREMGPLEKKALKKHQIEKKTQEKENASSQQPKHQSQQQQVNQSANPTNNQMDNQVSSILANDELRSILLDPKMQQIMEECSTQGTSKLRYYMGHEEYGPKLRMLMEAGLIRLG